MPLDFLHTPHRNGSRKIPKQGLNIHPYRHIPFPLSSEHSSDNIFHSTAGKHAELPLHGHKLILILLTRSTLHLCIRGPLQVHLRSSARDHLIQHPMSLISGLNNTLPIILCMFWKQCLHRSLVVMFYCFVVELDLEISGPDLGHSHYIHGAFVAGNFWAVSFRTIKSIAAS